MVLGEVLSKTEEQAGYAASSVDGEKGRNKEDGLDEKREKMEMDEENEKKERKERVEG